MDQKQINQKQTGRLVTGIIAAALFFINAIIVVTSSFSVSVLIFFAMTAAMVLFALGKRLPSAIITFVCTAMWIVNIISIVDLRTHYVYMYENYEIALFSAIAVLIGYALLGVAMILPKAKFAALVLPAVTLIFDIIQVNESKYYLEEPMLILGILFVIVIYVLAALSCILAKPEAKKAATQPNGQAPVAGQTPVAGQAPMNTVQQPNIQPVAYDQQTGSPIYGYDQFTGRPIYGYDQNGRPVYGFDQSGYPIIGFDPNGYPIYGYDQYGQPIYEPAGYEAETDSWRQSANERLEEDMKNVEKKRYTSGLVRVFLLNIITFGIYRLYWIYKTTKFLNRYDTMNPKRDPGLSLLFCMFVPFYAAYWMYKTNLALEGMDEANVMAESAALMVGVFDIVAPQATLIYTQSKINDVVNGSMERQSPDFSDCKRSPVSAFFWSFITGGLLGFFWTLRVATAIQNTKGFALSPVAWAILGVIFPPANMFFALQVGRVIDSGNNRRCAHLAIASAMIPSFHIAILQERINQEI
ncbi:MAG: DUF4234 domain-containing protein [Clostridia bacterium]|nr:DUF4234 domain-containing protein [Clostridia bacterium]